jgi:hypothetical protein
MCLVVELLPETKRILAEYPRLQALWRDNITVPTFPSRNPREVCFYEGDSFTPVFRLVDGELDRDSIQPSDENLSYAFTMVCDDIVTALSVGDQVIFDYSGQVDLPDFRMTAYEDELTSLESQLDAARLALAEVS